MLEYLFTLGRGVVLMLACSAVLAASGAITLDEILALAQGNPTVAAAQAQRDAATAALQTARAYPNPELEFLMGPAHTPPQPGNISGGPNGYSATTLAIQPIELPGVRGARMRREIAGIEVAEAATRNVSLTIESQAKQAFYEILRRQTEAKIAAQSQALLEQIRDRVKLRVETGEAPRYELVKAEAEVLSASKNRERAELQVNGAKSVLRALMGSLLPMNFELKGELTAPDTLPPIEELRVMVLERHPTVALVEGQIQQAQEQLQLERNLRYSQPKIMAGYERDPGLEQWLFGFSLPLPLWNQRQGPIAAAHAEIKRTTAVANQQRLILLREIEVAYTHYRIADRQEEAFESGLLKEAKLALKVAETAYRHGARGILDYLDAQRTYQTVRQDYINARFDKQLAYIEIERLLADDYGE
jgi:cobalt-zinc-cadmium efflux system outer membrane protein